MYIWNIAADIYGFSDTQIEDMIYINSSIKRFMDADYSMGISACKGMGKTLILKAKRMKMMQNQSYLFLPQNQLVDTPGPIILGRSQIRFFSSYHNWVSIWIFCICAYILSQDEFEDIRNNENLNNLSGKICQIIQTKNDGVFGVLSRLLVDNTRELLRDAMTASSVLFQLVQRINRQVVIFVDKIEEPFNRGYYKISGSSYSAEGRYNSSIWAYAQLAFAEAVYVLYSGRHHIKIFYSIRQEALHDGERITTEFAKISKEMVAKIEYSYHDLEKMFAKYIALERDENLYEPDKKTVNASLALCGISSVKHRSGGIETLWAYIYRHSLGRPRDIMEMAIALYENIVAKGKETSEVERTRECRHWINEISTRLCKEYIYGLEPFMNADDNIVFSHKLTNFLSLLPTNVYTLEAINQYCHLANCNEAKIDCSGCDYMHYFSTLYNIGLLGYIYKSASEDGYKNSIQHIGNSVFVTTDQTLPSAELYYVHPGVGNMIQEIRERNLQKYVSSNIIINSAETFINSMQLLRLKHLSTALLGNLNENRIFVTSTERDLRNEREEIVNFLKNRGYEVMAFEFPGFPPMPIEKTGHGATHDHCIDVALTCRHLIYIVDGRYGGPYSGQDYRSYIEEKSDIISIEPSVSFMEYLVSKAYNKDVAVYVSERVETARGEYIANGKPSNYKSNVVEEKHATEVFAQLALFNSLGNGTWYDKYNKINGLKQFLTARFPDLNED